RRNRYAARSSNRAGSSSKRRMSRRVLRSSRRFLSLKVRVFAAICGSSWDDVPATPRMMARREDDDVVEKCALRWPSARRVTGDDEATTANSKSGKEL